RCATRPSRAGGAASRQRPPATAYAESLRRPSATKTRSSSTTCDHTAPRCASTNCGRNARKKSAVFGLKHVHDRPAHEHAIEWHARRLGLVRPCPFEQLANPEVDEVGGARELDDAERDRRREDQRGD